jgi:tRNA dimethylallyltransferase
MQSVSDERLIVVEGPTAVGKSDIAVSLALAINGEIISADSRQIYKGLNIGTGKISQDEMRGIPHHLLDIENPDKRFSVVEFQKQAETIIESIISRNKVSIICGGTGFYIEAITNGIVLPEVPANEVLRQSLLSLDEDTLMKKLHTLDPIRASTIDSHNKRRVIRSIEIATALGKVPPIAPLSKYSNRQVLKIGLILPDEILRDKINKRLLARLQSGMIEEAENLHKNGLSFERMRELGLEYKFLADFLDGKLSKEDMISELSTAIWHYARRQKTWFRRDKEIKWFSPQDYNDIEKVVKEFLKN